MAKHEITIHENTGATKEKAPYLGTYVTKDAKGLSEIAAAVAPLCGLPEIQVYTILAGAFAEFVKMEKESAVWIKIDGMTIMMVIRGKFDSSDAAFDSSVNSLEIAIRLDDDVKNALADVTPTIVTDETSTKVRLDNVADVDMPRPYQVVHGQNPFKCTGINLVTTDEGAAVYFENSAGTTFPCTVQEVISKQEFTAKSDALLEGGDYKLVVKSRGGDAEGQLQTTFRKVKYLKIEPTLKKVTITKFTAQYVSDSAKLTIDGTNLDATDQYSAVEGDPEQIIGTVTLNDGAEQTLTFNNREALLGGAKQGDTVKVTLKINAEKTDFDQNPVTASCMVE